MCRSKMSRVAVFIVVMTFVIGVAAIDHAVAGDKVKGRCVWYSTKWEAIEVGDVEGHVIAVYEMRGIVSILEGTYKGAKPDGAVIVDRGYCDLNVKAGTGFCHSYDVVTDSEGNIRYYEGEAKPVGEGVTEGTYWATGGTGACEGIKEKGTFRSYDVGGGQSYTDWEGEYEYVR